MAEPALAEIGSNNPPPDLLLGDALRDRLLDEHSKLLKRRDELVAAAARIPPIDSEEIAQKVSDFLVQVGAVQKAATAARVKEKEPYLEGGRGVDGFFANISAPLEGVKTGVGIKLTRYMQAKEAEKRRQREEWERIAREEEAQKRRDAEEAAAKITNDKTLADALAKDEEAKTAAANVKKAEKAAAVKPAELSRTRGEYGAVSSLRTAWDFADLDRAELDIEALRQHLPTDGLEKAVRSFIRAGGRDLRGVRIYESTSAVVR